MPRQPTAHQTCPYGCWAGTNQPQHVVRFGFYHFKRGRRRRFRCRSCGQTFTRTTHTLYHGLRHSQQQVDRVAAMSVEGMSRAAISRVEHIDPHTVQRWLERATSVARRFNDEMIHNLALQELQADELQAIVPD